MGDHNVSTEHDSRHGLKAQLTLADGRDYPASTLILEYLLPAAREGLEQAGVDVEDRDRYLDVIEERVERDQTGAQWSLRSLEAMDGRGARETRHRALTEAMLEQQKSGEPVSRWALARLHGAGDWSRGFQTVAQLMSTDLFTAHPDDLVDLAASVMEWRHIRHVPVEDDEGWLVGLIWRKPGQVNSARRRRQTLASMVAGRAHFRKAALYRITLVGAEIRRLNA